MRKYHTINYSILGARVAKRRNQLNMSQKQVAELLDCNESYISKLENGNANPSLKTLYRLAQGLGKKLTIHFEPVYN
jgi:transcriptional regulator with XRE-family HTH domain